MRTLMALLTTGSAALFFALAWTGPPVGAAPPRAAPEIEAELWLNSEPLRRSDLDGKVVLVEFWTFGCYNCKNIEPYVKAWHARYADAGLVVIAVHSPEFRFERDLDEVRSYVEENGIEHPVAVDNRFDTWRRFGNWAWPTLYVVDRRGVIRHTRVGEGGYRETEAVIQQLLAEGDAAPAAS